MLPSQLLLTLLFLSSYLTKPAFCQSFYRERAAPIHKSHKKAKQIHYCYCVVPTSDRSQRFPIWRIRQRGSHLHLSSLLFLFIPLLFFRFHPSPRFHLLKSPFHPIPRLLRSVFPFTLVPHLLERHREASNLLTVTDGCAEAHNGGSRRVITLQLTFQGKTQSWGLTWRRPI